MADGADRTAAEESSGNHPRKPSDCVCDQLSKRGDGPSSPRRRAFGRGVARIAVDSIAVGARLPRSFTIPHSKPLISIAGALLCSPPIRAATWVAEARYRLFNAMTSPIPLLTSSPCWTAGSASYFRGAWACSPIPVTLGRNRPTLTSDERATSHGRHTGPWPKPLDDLASFHLMGTPRALERAHEQIIVPPRRPRRRLFNSRAPQVLALHRAVLAPANRLVRRAEIPSGGPRQSMSPRATAASVRLAHASDNRPRSLPSNTSSALPRCRFRGRADCRRCARTIPSPSRSTNADPRFARTSPDPVRLESSSSPRRGATGC